MTVEALPEIETVTLDDIAPYLDDKDPNRLTHIINPPNNLHIFKPGMEAQDIVDIARISQIEITALCGYKFVPKHNPDKYDACQACMTIASDIMKGMGE